jgi:hypothetical protein
MAGRKDGRTKGRKGEGKDERMKAGEVRRKRERKRERCKMCRCEVGSSLNRKKKMSKIIDWLTTRAQRRVLFRSNFSSGFKDKRRTRRHAVK